MVYGTVWWYHNNNNFFLPTGSRCFCATDLKNGCGRSRSSATSLFNPPWCCLVVSRMHTLNMKAVVLSFTLGFTALTSSLVDAFVTPTGGRPSTKALAVSREAHRIDNVKAPNLIERTCQSTQAVATSLLLGTLLFGALPAIAAPKDISGMDFSGQDLTQQRDFSSVVARKTNFRNANLEGVSFDKAILTDADFTGANVRSASFVDATLDGASFKDALAEKATFSATILDVGNFENVDLTDSMWPSKLRIMICDMPEIKGANPTTGADSRDSLMCTDISYSS